MKKIILAFLCFILAFFICLTALDRPFSEIDETETNTSDETFKGIWLTYSELSVKGKNYTKKEYGEYIRGLFSAFKEKGINNIFLHVRPFCDAIYFSELFESSEYSSGKRGKRADFDILRLCIEEGKSLDLKIHAWINPYRVLSVPDTSLITGGRISSWAKDGSSTLCVTDSGVYLNPASAEAEKFIIDGVKEVLYNYDVDGIHFDDYFYPEDFGYGDSKEYNEYIKNGGKLSLHDFRREKVNNLILLTYTTVKSYDENLLFSVSPAGDIEKNIKEIYADVTLWCNGGYCDMIIPQLYFGFENESKPFEGELKKWLKLTKNSDVKLVPGLALYKTGERDEFAGKGKDEWVNDSDIIERQVQLSLTSGAYGVSFFSAGHISKLNLK